VTEHRLFAALYDGLTGPLEQGMLGERRAGLLADLGGQVLDVGAGTGANLPHFRSACRVVATEPDPAMRRRLAAKLAGAPGPGALTGDAAEALRQPDASFDAVMFTQAPLLRHTRTRRFARSRFPMLSACTPPDLAAVSYKIRQSEGLQATPAACLQRFRNAGGPLASRPRH